MRIYITRHGETEWNKAGLMQGWNNSNLTEKGIENAKRLGSSLKHINFDRIYCSPLGRALQTAECIRGDKNTEIVIKENLKEMGFGCWEGMEHEKIKELYPEQQHNFWNKPHLYKPVDGESYEELISRVKSVIDEIISNTSDNNVMIVTHAAVLKAIYKIIRNYSLEDFWSLPYMHDTCLTIFEFKNGEMRCLLEADTSHMDQLINN